MGCANSKQDDSVSIKHGAGGSQKEGIGKPEADVEAFREGLFSKVGTPMSYNPGSVIISEGKSSNCAIYIRKGTTVLTKKGKELAKRGKGDLIGEMSLLLGDTPDVTITAETTVETYVVEHTALTDFLAEQPSMCGRVFRMMAATLSERIGEASAKMRSQVRAPRASDTSERTAPPRPSAPPLPPLFSAFLPLSHRRARSPTYAPLSARAPAGSSPLFPSDASV